MPLAKIAPTSIVFGAWDSRDTQAKMPRLIASTIRAYDVRKLTRSAQYVPPVRYEDDGLLGEATDKKMSDAYAKQGFSHVPSSAAHGGVIATGGIRRDATLHLAALRLLAAPANEEGAEDQTTKLQRYVLGLALTAFTFSPVGYLRQGCSLVLDPDKLSTFEAVYGNGRRETVDLKHIDALAYARKAAEAFGIDPDRRIPLEGVDRTVEFDKDRARQEVTEGGITKQKSRKAAVSRAK
jgi:CRISPR-associated protein Csb1